MGYKPFEALGISHHHALIFQTPPKERAKVVEAWNEIATKFLNQQTQAS